MSARLFSVGGRYAPRLPSGASNPRVGLRLAQVMACNTFRIHHPSPWKSLNNRLRLTTAPVHRLAESFLPSRGNGLGWNRALSVGNLDVAWPLDAYGFL